MRSDSHTFNELFDRRLGAAGQLAANRAIFLAFLYNNYSNDYRLSEWFDE